jgi:hypothetical protein
MVMGPDEAQIPTTTVMARASSNLMAGTVLMVI